MYWWAVLTACRIQHLSRWKRRKIYFIKQVKGTPERKTLWLVQTPQVFNIQLIKEAYQKLINEKIENATDDAMVVEQMMGHTVKLYPGAYENIKITTPEDLLVAESFLAEK